MTRSAKTLWRFTFMRVAPALLALLLLVGSAGFLLVTRPALERHAQLLVNTLLPSSRPECLALEAHARELSSDAASGIRLLAATEAALPTSAWLLPFDALLVARMRERSGLDVRAHSTVEALRLNLRCASGEVRLALDRRVALGAAPDLALFAWVGALICGALGIAAWLSRALSSPLRRLMADLRGSPLGAAPAKVAPSGIIELDQLGFEVDALRQRASDAVASRTALLMGLSHDLRTPLARVRLILDTAQPICQADTHEMKAHLLEMQEAMDEFMRAANAMATEPVEGGARIVWSRLQTHFADPRVVFDWEADGADTSLNSAALLRIASNLIDNALRHGEGRVQVSWRGDAGRWAMCVEDEGRGIALQDRERALRPFGRNAPEAGEQDVHHAGVGLALARILCEHNGWHLRLEAGPLRGLRARVERP